MRPCFHRAFASLAVGLAMALALIVSELPANRRAWAGPTLVASKCRGHQQPTVRLASWVPVGR